MLFVYIFYLLFSAFVTAMTGEDGGFQEEDPPCLSSLQNHSGIC